MRPRRKQSVLSLLPTITEVQESGSPHHVCHAHSLDDYLDSMRVLSPHPPPSWYTHRTAHTTTATATTTALHPQPCRQLPPRLPTPRQVKYPAMASLSLSSSSSLSLPAPPPPSLPANPSLALALVAVSPESISLTLEGVSPQVTPPCDGRAWWWPHQDPLSWLFTQSQGDAAVASTPLPLGESSVPDAVCLV